MIPSPHRPTDEWLLVLLDEKSPDDLTPEEFAAVRAAAAASPAVRAAVQGHVRFEQALYERFGDPPVSAELIRRRHAATGRGRTFRFGLFALLFAAVGGAAWWWSRHDAGRGGHAVVVRPTEPSAPGTPRPTRPEPIEAPKPAVPAVAATRPPEPTPPAAPAEAMPWSAALADDARVIPFAESAFATLGETTPGFEPADEFTPGLLKKWVTQVPGKPFAVHDGEWRGRKFAGFDGIGRFAATWRADAVLRFAAFDVNQFALHFWSGDVGVTLRFYPHQRPQQLAAYAVTREGGGPEPKTFRLAATDGGTWATANAGPIEIRHQDGFLVVTRGAVPLVVAPLASAPTEIYLEGPLRVRTLALYRGEPAPLPAPPAHRDLLPAGPIENLAWTTSAEPAASLAKSPDSLTLAAAAAAPPGPRRAAWAAIKLADFAPAGTGLCEAVFRLGEISPGTGLYLGDADGKPRHALFASENGRLGVPMLAYGWSATGDTLPEPRWQWDVDPKNEIAAGVGPGTWIKLLIGPGGLKAYVSSDGERWGPATRSPERSLHGPIGSVGFYAVADGKPRPITLTALRIRELSGLAAAADPALRTRVPAFGEKPPANAEAWRTFAVDAKPAEVDAAAWMRAVSVETLARGTTPEAVAEKALSGLIGDAAASDRPPAETLALFHDAALLADLWGASARPFAEKYGRLAIAAADRGGPTVEIAAVLSEIETAYLSAPIWTETRPWAVPPPIVREVVAAAVWDRSDAAPAAARRIAAYLTPSHPEQGWSSSEDRDLTRLAAWAGTAAADRGGADVVGRAMWRHPLATEPGREAATVAAELDAALAAGAYDDAARLLSTAADLSDLLPASGDPGRFLSPAGLAAEAAATHPDLVPTLTAKFGPAGLLRVRQAIAAGDENAVRAATIRFYGTEAAAEAHRWLGDAAAAAGLFADAAEHYAAAVPFAPADRRPDLEARRRLAAALGGREEGEPAAGPVAFGPESLPADAFERLVQDLRSARGGLSPTAAAPEPIPAPVALKLEPRHRLEGDLGRSPGRGEFKRFDWAGRQTGVALGTRLVYFSNRFQVAAYDPQEKRLRWKAGLGGEQGEAHALPGVAFTPLPLGEAVYCRRLTNRGPELVACQTSDGKVVWRTDAELAVASDPVERNGWLFALTVPTKPAGVTALSLTVFHPVTGAAVSSTPILSLYDAGDPRPWAELTPAEGDWIVTMPGAVVRCDATGGIRWLRALPHLPAAADPESDRLSPSRPIVDAGRLVLPAVGGRAAICLNAATGAIVWTRPLGSLEDVCGLAGPVVVLRTQEALLGVDRATGGTKWTLARGDLLGGVLCGEATLLATARGRGEKQPAGLALLWIDPATGDVRGEATVPGDDHKELLCGPLFLREGAIWGFVGDNWQDARRTLVELVPQPSEPRPAPGDDRPLAPWLAARR